MKKMVIILLLGGVLVLSGCAKTSAPQGSTGESKVQTSSNKSNAAATTSTGHQSYKYTIFENKDYGYSFNLPIPFVLKAYTFGEANADFADSTNNNATFSSTVKKNTNYITLNADRESMLSTTDKSNIDVDVHKTPAENNNKFESWDFCYKQDGKYNYSFEAATENYFAYLYFNFPVKDKEKYMPYIKFIIDSYNFKEPADKSVSEADIKKINDKSFSYHNTEFNYSVSLPNDFNLKTVSDDKSEATFIDSYNNGLGYVTFKCVNNEKSMTAQEYFLNYIKSVLFPSGNYRPEDVVFSGKGISIKVVHDDTISYYKYYIGNEVMYYEFTFNTRDKVRYEYYENTVKDYLQESFDPKGMDTRHMN